ncbi:MAG: SUF system NifU family Fe-S cluster assembly protein [Dehalococcoidia bacterium]|nr:SUF system NifU family Fe-S cluster assembly protein [Dehalococcoidia bacterium]
MLAELYREILLDHYRSPRNRGTLDGRATHRSEGANPLCGDELVLELAVETGRVTEVAFLGRGCAISQASASMMTIYLRDRTAAEALEAVWCFQQLMLSGTALPEEFGDIEALAGVAKFPVRVKCASLAWKTLEQALSSDGVATVSTDEGS